MTDSSRRVLAALSTMALALTLAACGGGSDSADTGGTGGTGSSGDTGGTGGTGGGAALTCDTKLFQAGTAVSVPTSAQLASFARTYTGSEGNYTMTGFVKTGTATLVFSAAGVAEYNGKAYATSSVCYENNATVGQMLYVHFTSGAHLDLFANGKWTGASPANPALGVDGM